MVKIKIIQLFLLSVLLVQCKKNEELKDELKAGFEAAMLMQRTVSVAAVMDDFANGIPGDFFGLGAVINRTDINPLSPDYNYEINLGDGVVCKDGLTRKGRFAIHFNDSQGVYNLRSSAEDSFALLTSRGWEYLIVNYIRHPESAISFYDEFDIAYLSATMPKMENGLIKYKFSLQPSKSLVECDRVFSVNSTMNMENEKYAFSAADLLYRPGCISNIIGGSAGVSNEKKSLNIQFDPFSNQACDDVVKVFEEKKFQKTEFTGSTW